MLPELYAEVGQTFKAIGPFLWAQSLWSIGLHQNLSHSVSNSCDKLMTMMSKVSESELECKSSHKRSRALKVTFIFLFKKKNQFVFIFIHIEMCPCFATWSNLILIRVTLVFICNNKPCHTPLKCRLLIKKCDHIRPKCLRLKYSIYTYSEITWE